LSSAEQQTLLNDCNQKVQQLFHALGAAGSELSAFKAMLQAPDGHKAEVVKLEGAWKGALEAEKQARLMGTPHLMNLNEDPMLDRKVTYDI
jgi:hypothetical protein